MSRHRRPPSCFMPFPAAALALLCLAAPVAAAAQTLGDGHREWAGLVTRGRVQAALGNTGDAVALLERAGEQAWTMREAVATQLALAEVLTSSIVAGGDAAGYDAEAIQEMFYFAAQAVSGHLRVRAIIGHAELLLRLDKPKQAIELLRRTEPPDLDAADEITRGRFGLVSGRALDAVGRATDAMTALLGALRQDPSGQAICEQLLAVARDLDQERGLAAVRGAAEVLITAGRLGIARDLLTRGLAAVDWRRLSAGQTRDLEALLARFFVAARTGPDEFQDRWWPLVGGITDSPGAGPSPRLRQLHTAFLHELTTTPDARQAVQLFSEWTGAAEDARLVARLLGTIAEHYARSGDGARALERSTWAAGLLARAGAGSRETDSGGPPPVPAEERDPAAAPSRAGGIALEVRSRIAADPVFQGMAVSVAVRDGEVSLAGAGFEHLGDDDRDALLELIGVIDGVSEVTAPLATGD